MAAYESKQIANLPIMSVSEGERVGKVKDVLVDATGHRVVGFLVEPTGGEREMQVLLAEDVRAVGQDAVTIEDRGRLHPLAACPPVKTLLEQQMPIKGKAVFTEDGKRLGNVDEFTVDPVSFTVDTYFVVPAGLGGLFLTGAPRRIPADWVVSVGPDALVVRAAESEQAGHQR